MQSTKLVSRRKPYREGYGAALKAGLQQTTRQVQAMHHTIADKSFNTLRRVPLLSLPARLVKRAHDAIADGVYAAIHHGGGLALTALDPLARRALPEHHARTIDSVLNGVFGDYLARSGNGLAIEMGFYHGGEKIPLSPAGLAPLLSNGGDKLCVFIHGLCCDEHCWMAGDDTADSVNFGQRLQVELGYAPFYLRYNSGLGLNENGQQLAAQLDALLAACPQPPDEVVLIGHSMGGLIARRACEHAAAHQSPWLALTRMVICLGSPHAGAGLERLGQGLTRVMQYFDVSAPLARIASARSQGIRHLRHGLRDTGGSAPPVPGLAYRFVGASLSHTPEHPVYRLVGDGLVTLDSATEPGLAGDVASVRLTGIGHMTLLRSPMVFAQLRAWLSTDSPPDAQVL
ncbi:triacylglycerol lipase [Chitinimonas sp. BJYL2]|uniref:esterase/lipase family protein n=1 Tax=Chitinimonas sp. BJYL2 TaxID=2976696 RepID=UPI0022B30D67|nr:alpha/beta fold hydrolase [Chitinimonas sp. BJYL2]